MTKRERGANDKFSIVIPSSIKIPGWCWSSSTDRWEIRILYHTLQCDQRWLFYIRIGRRVFGYLTRGDVRPKLMRYSDRGWYFPLWGRGAGAREWGHR